MGGILHEILIDVPPFDGERIMQVLKLAAACEITPPQDRVPWALPPRLCAIAMQAMSPNPADRYQSAQELKADLLAFMQSGWHFPVERIPAATAIISEGTGGDCAYIIVSGTCRVYKKIDGKERQLAELGPGDVFGETAVFTDEARGATVRAVDRVEVKVVPRAFFETDLGGGGALGIFVKAVARRFNERNQRALELEHEVRTAEMMAQVYRYLGFTGVKSDDGRTLMAPWSRLSQQLTARLGLDEAKLVAKIQQDPLFTVDVARNMIAAERI